MAHPATLVDGRRAGTVPAADRGLHYGDGLFETVAVVSGRALVLDRHLARLEHGCGRLGIPFPGRETLTAEADALAAERARAVLKVIVTRGVGGRGYRPPEAPRSTRVLSLHPWPGDVDRRRDGGVAVRLCRTRLASNPALAGLKHLNRLEQVLARAEWSGTEPAEGLMLDGEGKLVEGISSNVFVVRAGRLLTPEVDRCGVAGVVRAIILERAPAQLGLAVEVRPLPLEALGDAEEVFLTNSVIGLWPVRAVERRRYRIGAVARRLQAELARMGVTA